MVSQLTSNSVHVSTKSFVIDKTEIIYMWHGQFLIKPNIHLVNDTYRQRQPTSKQYYLQLIIAHKVSRHKQHKQ